MELDKYYQEPASNQTVWGDGFSRVAIARGDMMSEAAPTADGFGIDLPIPGDLRIGGGNRQMNIEELEADAAREAIDFVQEQVKEEDLVNPTKKRIRRIRSLVVAAGTTSSVPQKVQHQLQINSRITGRKF